MAAHSPPRRRAPRPAPRWRRAAAVALALASAACRREHAPAPQATVEPAGAAIPAAEGLVFTLADLAAASRFDARFQRVVALAGEYKTSLTFDRAPQLTEHTDVVAKRLDEALPEADRAAEGVRDPRDREHVQRLLAAARRWPGLLRATRAELVSSPSGPSQAARALEATDDEVARALEAYRAFRATWRIGDSPVEPEPVLEFLRARRDLDAKELELGRTVMSPAGLAATDLGPVRASVEATVAKAREAASRIDAARADGAKRYVDAEAQALAALAGMAAPGALDEQRGRDALSYQIAKTRALEALADYVALTAKSGPAAR